MWPSLRPPPQVAVPATVHIEEGAHTAAFPVVAGDGLSVGEASVTATYETVTSRFAAKLQGTLELSASTALGGTTDVVAGTIHVAPATLRRRIYLTSDQSSIVPPKSVVAEVGQTEVAFPIAHQRVSADVTGRIRATMNGKTLGEATLSLTPVRAILFFDRSTFYDDEPVTGKVRPEKPLIADATVSLLCDRSDLLGLPQTVAIPAGAASVPFSGTLKPVAGHVDALVRAEFNGAVQSVTLGLEQLPSAAISMPKEIIATYTPVKDRWGFITDWEPPYFRADAVLSKPMTFYSPLNGPRQGLVIGCPPNWSYMALSYGLVFWSGQTEIRGQVMGRVAYNSDGSFAPTSQFNFSGRTGKQSFVVKVVKCTINGVTATDVKGGENTNLRVTINGYDYSARTLKVTSSDPAVEVPDTLNWARSATPWSEDPKGSDIYSLKTKKVKKAKRVQITVSCDGVTQSCYVTLKP